MLIKVVDEVTATASRVLDGTAQTTPDNADACAVCVMSIIMFSVLMSTHSRSSEGRLQSPEISFERAQRYLHPGQ